MKDFGAVISGTDADPVDDDPDDASAPIGSKFVLVVVLISFLSCALSLQAAASRLIYSYARDGMIFGSHLCVEVRQDAPRPAVRAALGRPRPRRDRLGSMVSTDALTKI